MNRSTDNQASITSTWSGLSCRLAFVGYLATVALCSVLAFMSLLRGQPELLLGSMISGLFALGFRSTLRNHPSPLMADDLDENGSCSMLPPHERAGGQLELRKLASLLQELDSLERARGSRHFDPWALQAARSEIRAAVDGNPALRRRISPDR